MRQFYTMHEQICTEFKAWKQITNEKCILTINTKTEHKNQTKQCLVHKVPSEVAILSHVCGVAAIVHHSQVKWVGYCAFCGETRNSCLLSVENLNRSRHLACLVSEIGYEDWLRKGKVLAPQLHPT